MSGAETFPTLDTDPGLASELHVLHVTECFAGGVSRAIESMVENSPARVTHHLLYEGDDKPSPGLFASTRSLPDSHLVRPFVIRRTAADLGASAIHAHSSWAGVYARTIQMDAPVIYQPHCYKFDDPSSSRAVRAAVRLAERALSRRSALTVVLSPHERELGAGVGDPARLRMVPNVAAVPHPGVVAAQAPDERVFMIGRLARQKDPRFFAEVVAHIRALRPATRFDWIGGGEGTAEDELRRAGVRVTGWLTTAQLEAELRTPGLYLHSAMYEGFPLSVLDAAATGHPVIAREIAALKGTAIPQAQTAVELARLAVGVLDGDPEVVARVRHGNELLQVTMNARAQRRALFELYDEVTGALR